ncbi:MAG: tetratricopeptide repeat protein [Verrucomicrobiae bacterium]|nr:tetratricopeptide repeat protein [Verrucomicrobiae bacterium]
MKTTAQRPFRVDGWFGLLVAGLFLAFAHLRAAEAQTNTLPTRTTVAVLPWLPMERPPMSVEDSHWLETFGNLVAGELRQVAALRVLPSDAVVRELTRQLHAPPTLDQSGSTNVALVFRKVGESLKVTWVISGALSRTGATWIATAKAVETQSGNSGEEFRTTSTNWFELRDRVVQQVLRHLTIAPSPEEQKGLGKVWTASREALEWLSQAMSESTGDTETVELCRRALASDPQFAEACYVLAVALHNLARDEEALHVASEGLKLRPDHYTAAQLHLIRANLLLSQGQARAGSKVLIVCTHDP